MDEVFVKLFNMGMTAGWMILAVLLLRLLLRKAPRWIHCLLWGFVVLRLVCPLSFQSVLSLVPSAETIRMNTVRYGETPKIESGVQAVNRVVNPVLENTFTPDVDDSVNPLAVWAYLAGIVSTAINVFARAVVRERRIPFEIVSPEPEITREKAMQAFISLRAQSEKNFPQGMSLDEINEEIRRARYGEEDFEWAEDRD